MGKGEDFSSQRHRDHREDIRWGSGEFGPERDIGRGDGMGRDYVGERDPVTEPIIGAAIEVHRVLGPGLLESVYETCLCDELERRGVEFQRQALLPITYKGRVLDCDLRMDILLPGLVIVEIKAVQTILPVHEAQLLTYMRLARISRGLLIHFNECLLKDGVRRKRL
jgi:GxxExxY protein